MLQSNSETGLNKIYFHTYDIFNNEDITERMRYFNSCHKAALRCGLTVKCIMEDEYPKLELWGGQISIC